MSKTDNQIERIGAIDLEAYRHLRTILCQHQNAAVKTISRTTLHKCAKTFGMLDGNNLMLDSDSELTILMDFCIYSHRQKGKSLTGKYLAKLAPTEAGDEAVVREAMARPRYSMYRIEKSIPGSGLHVRDLVRGDSLFLVDKMLSKTLKSGRVLGGRLIPTPSYWITTGACFPLSEDVVAEVEGTFLPALRMTEGDLTSLSEKAEEELATVVIGAGMEGGTTSMVRYQ